MNRIRIAQIGDSHFCLQSRWEECIRLHDHFAEDMEARAARGEGPDLIIHTGDLYERQPNEIEQDAAERWVSRLAEIAPVVMVDGNHARGWISILRRLRTKHPVTVELGCGVHIVAGVAVACIAWPRKAELVASAPPGATPDQIAALASQALRNVFAGLGDVLAQHDGPRVLAAHAMLCGATTSSGQPLIGVPMEVGVADLALARAQFYALGHIHKHQVQWHSHSPILYAGSPRRTAFGEVEPKGYVWIEFVKRDGEWSLDDSYPGNGYLFVALPARQMLDVEATFGELPEDYAGAPLRHGWTEGNAFPLPEDVRNAEVRFRYSVSADHQTLAKAAADALETGWRANGAVDVQSEPRLLPVCRARAPEMAEAETVEDQLRSFWRARGLEIAPEREVRLVAKLDKIVGDAVQGARNVGALRWTRIRHRGFGTMQPVDIDFDSAPGPILALVGPIGSGKSSTLELLLGGLYGEMPTRGTLGTLATSRTARLDLGIQTSDGSAYTIRHDVDGLTRKGTVHVTDTNGKTLPELPENQVSRYYAWIAKRTPDAKVVEASLFSCQGSGGLLAMKEGELKAVLLRALGCEQLEGWAEKCRKAAREASGKLDVAASRLADERARAVPLADVERRLAGAEDGQARAHRAVTDIATRIYAAREAEAKHREQTAARTVASETWARLREAADALVDRCAALTHRLREDRELLENGDAVRSAVKELAALTERETVAREARAKAQADADAARLEARTASQVVIEARRRYAETAERMRFAEQRLNELNSVEEAAGLLPEFEQKVSDAEAALAAADANVTRLRDVALVGADGRVTKLRGHLEEILDSSPHAASVIAGAGLREDDALVEQARTTPALLRAALEERVRCDGVLLVKRADLNALRVRAARLPERESLTRDVTTLRSTLEFLTQEGQAAKKTETVALETLDWRMADLRKHEEAWPALQAERARLTPLAQQADRIVAAEARIAALEPELASARREADARDAELAAIVIPEVEPYDPRVLLAALAAHPSAMNEERTAIAACVRLGDEVLATKASLRRQDELEAERVSHEVDVADWSHLGDALGRDGIQGLLVDAAGPKLTVLANDLLHGCFGSRFTVRLDTVPLDADGKRALEGCKIFVSDTKPREDGSVGGEREGRSFSGGERTILNEALGLAVSVLVSQRSGLREPMIVRDEPTASLSPEAGHAYIAMLRRAAAMMRANKIVFVTHMPALADLADGRIDLGVVATAVASKEAEPVEAPKKRRSRKAA